MLSRRDLIQSQQYLTLRQVKALLAHRPDPLDWAGRHGAATAFAGVMILVIALAAAAVIGLIFPGGSKKWQSCDSIIVERDTGATYVCDATSRTLYPVANFGSAALIMGSSTSVRIASESLTWPRGALLGLPGAPDELVSAKKYLSGAWSLCSVSRSGAAARGGPATIILAGAQPAAAQPVDERAVLLVGPDGTRYLLWSGHRYPIREPEHVLPVLGFAAQDGLAVADAWLAPIPLGAALGPIDVSDRGARLFGFPHATVGQLVRLPGGDGADRVYLVRREGLQEVTPLQQALVRGGGTPPVALTPAALGGTPIVARMSLAGFPPPEKVPAFVRPQEGLLCAAMLADTVTVTVDGTLPSSAAGVLARRGAAQGVPLADAVLVAPGHAVLARSMASPGATGGPLVLLTDVGVRHACANDQVPKMLGFAGTPVLLPAALLERVEEGVALDPAQARLAVPPRPRA
ncbi:type VII secretion protein EccB [Micromonospora polyrhachis]|uniref:Type VII secretion protein EccB n=1 Tax=Micromonospora polyrhachis TaxID=1282883 RepID=A0A7W7SLS6_9ACTN|nr:type VII secretion protein EccB [Micromonospora polyrhachis]MBB4957130.1 type VII secretion protein EccB [Micromonospora polyrhachis]